MSQAADAEYIGACSLSLVWRRNHTAGAECAVSRTTAAQQLGGKMPDMRSRNLPTGRQPGARARNAALAGPIRARCS